MEKVNLNAEILFIEPANSGLIVYIGDETKQNTYVFTDMTDLCNFISKHFLGEEKIEKLSNSWLDLYGPDDVWGGGS